MVWLRLTFILSCKVEIIRLHIGGVMTTTIMTCPACGLSKGVPTEKIPLKEVKVSCPRCKKVFAYDRSKEIEHFVIQPVADDVD